MTGDCEPVRTQCKEFDAILKPLSTSRILYLGTPQTEMSIYNILADERGYTFRIWPAKYPTDKQVSQYRGKLAPFILGKLNNGATEGTTTDPDRFSDSDLQERLLSYGKSGFSLQFMLNTSLSDMEKYPLKCGDFIVHSVGRNQAPADFERARGKDNETGEQCLGLHGDRWYKPMYVSETFLPYTSKVLAIDPSGKGLDETGYAVGYFLNGYIHIAEAGGFIGGYEETTLNSLAIIAKRHEVNEVVIEGNYGGGMYTKLLTPYLTKHHKCGIEEIINRGQKEVRIIDTIEPPLMEGRLVVDPRVIIKDREDTEGNPMYSLFYQLSRISRERGSLRHDDRLDALALLVGYFVEVMDLDAKKREAMHKEELLDMELEKFREYFFGKSDRDRSKCWM